MSVERTGVLGSRPDTPVVVIGAAALGVVGGAAGQGAAVVEGQLLELTALTGVWIVIATAIGCFASAPRSAALYSSAYLLIAVFSFYTLGWVIRGDLSPLPLIALWLAGAMLAGPVFGFVGWASTRANWLGSVSLAAILALLLGEAVRLLLVQGFPPSAWVPVVFNTAASGALFVFAPADSRRRGQAALILPVLLALATFFFGVILPFLIGVAIPL